MAAVRFRTAVVAVALLQSIWSDKIAAAQRPDQEYLPARPISVDLDRLPNLRVVVVSDGQLKELDRWIQAFTDWQKWNNQWLNRRQPGKWSYAVERTQKPDPPDWLDDACGLLPDDDRFARGCDLLAAWREDLITTANRQSTVASAGQQERPVTKSVWWRHLHVDGLWSTTQSSVTSFGIFGAHYTVELESRLQIFATPGILLVSVPSIVGKRDLSAATDWGISYRLFDVGRSTVHFNLVHAWMLTNRSNLIYPNVTLAGFSVSFRPPAR